MAGTDPNANVAPASAEVYSPPEGGHVIDTPPDDTKDTKDTTKDKEELKKLTAL
jgi:hypothetical protein